MAAKKKAAEQEPEKPVLQIVEMYVENIKRIKVAHIKPSGSMIVVTGKNGSGKTSVLDAIEWALRGTSTVPSQPIHKGKGSGTIKLDMGEFIVTRTFTRIDPTKSAKGNTYLSRLVIEGKDRSIFKTPQDVLNRLMGSISFDPLAFTRMDPKKQFETLRTLVPMDGIAELDADQDADYDDRRKAGHDIDSAKARLAAMPAPQADLPAKPIDVSEITKRLENAANANNIRAAGMRQRDDLLRQSVNAAAEARSLREHAATLRKQAEDLDKQAEKMVELGGKKKSDGEAMFIPDEVDTAQVSAELTQATQTNLAIAAAAQRRAVAQDVTEAEAKYNKLDERMKKRAEERQRIIESAAMPIPGLSIGAGEVLYEGLPFSQASSAIQIRASMALAMASNPTLRVLRITDGSLLDDESLQLVAESAAEHRYQVWIERVDDSMSPSVVMQDGEAHGEDVPA